MRILTIDNQIADTDMLTQSVHYWVLSFRDSKNPDFYCEELPHMELSESPVVALKIGPFKLVMPIIWSVLVTDYDTIECVALHDILGKKMEVFAANPINGFFANYYTIETGAIYTGNRWTAPPLSEKDMLVVPLGLERKETTTDSNERVKRGPVCAIFSPTKMEITNKTISDIWE